MTLLRDVLTTAIQRLAAAGSDTPRLDAEVLLAHTLGYEERTRLYLQLDQALSAQELARFENLLQRRERREPVAYLTGHKEFFGLDFEVNPHVLIPRPETELLVEATKELVIGAWRLEIENLPITNYQLPIIIADIGAGSGCIAVALAKYLPQATIVAVDLSPEALQVARRNAERHGVAEKITFLQGDLLQPLAHPVDIIVSNPPYVSRSALAAAQPEVSQYEPRLALDGGPDGLALIQRLLRQAVSRLKPGGALLIEIGFEQGEAVKALARRCFPSAQLEIRPDLAGLDRLLLLKM